MLVDRLVRQLPAVDRAELERVAGLLDRRDRKYLIPADRLPDLVDRLSDGATVLDTDGRRTFGYDTVYFDTPERTSYLDTARRRPRRWKVGKRTYTDTRDRYVEVKLRDRRGRTVKHRRPARSRPGVLGPEDRSFVSSFGSVPADVDHLEPVLLTRYHRSTLLLPDERARVTIDRAVQFVGPDDSAAIAEYVIVETKSQGPPTPVDRDLWRAGHRPVPISKFGTGMAVLDPGLPSNRWHRTLRRLFPTAPPLAHARGPAASRGRRVLG